MDSRFNNISMNGRMAYTIMCVESYLISVYPNKDWKLVANAMWKATNMNWADWTDYYSVYIPEVLFQYDSYDENDFSSSFTREEYARLLELYSDITEGLEDDPCDEVNCVLNKPFDMAMVYEGTGIGNGSESIDIIHDLENILNIHNISLPDVNKVSFSNISELNGWGNDFEGTYLSVILNS